MNLLKYTMLSMLFGSMIAALALSANAQSRLWISDTRTDGNIGGRDGADDICFFDKHNPKIEGMQTRAFVSFTASDNMQTMPRKFGVPEHDAITRDDGTTLIANNYKDLFNGDLTRLINSVTPSHHNILVWTGADSDGSALENYNCKGFSSSDEDVTGSKGAAQYKNRNFLIIGGVNGCNKQTPIYCLTFRPEID